ncbi:MAG: collagen-like protein [Myxococcaceae bacterium]|nr:MAG: collagen-like protein [Myxococcaceae bacterium]
MSGKPFCDGANLSYCSVSGADAFRFGACSGGTDNNPVGCFTTDCPGDAAACCRPAKVRCGWSFSNPATTGRTYDLDEERDKDTGYCSAPSTCDQTALEFHIAPPMTTGTCPTLSHRSVHVTVHRPLPPLGQSVTLPNSNIVIHSGSATTACSAWTGTLTVHSDVPHWRISLDVTCSNSGASDIRIVGSASGDV